MGLFTLSCYDLAMLVIIMRICNLCPSNEYTNKVMFSLRLTLDYVDYYCILCYAGTRNNSPSPSPPNETQIPSQTGLLSSSAQRDSETLHSDIIPQPVSPQTRRRDQQPSPHTYSPSQRDPAPPTHSPALLRGSHTSNDRDSGIPSSINNGSYQAQREDESKPLLLAPSQFIKYKTMTNVSLSTKSRKEWCREHKKTWLCLAVALFLLFASVAFFSAGAYFYKHESDLIEMNALNQTSYSVGDEIIILGAVNADVFSMVTIIEKLQHGDSSHVSTVYLPAKSKLKKHVENIDKAYEGFYSPNPWRTTGEIESTGTYILDTGLINYMFCSTNPGQSTGVANAYIFDDEKSYFEYTGQSPGSQASSYIFHQAMEVGTFNQSICISFQYMIDKPAYYFVAIDTPSSLYYNYSYEIRDINLDRKDYSMECENVYEQHPCIIDLSSKTGLYYVLAYVRPHIDLESVTTHLHVFTSGQSYTVRVLWIFGVVCMGVGGFLFLIFLIIFLFSVCVCLYKVIVKKCLF